MVRVLRRSVTLAMMVALAAAVLAQAPPVPQGQAQPPGQAQAPGGGRRGGGRQGPQRDQITPAGTAAIAGRVLAADTGRPLKRARVIAAGAGRPQAATTDDQGRFRVTGLPGGTYTITASKTGFVDGAYGQRRAQRTGIPIDVTDGQQLTAIDIRLSRGGVITGHVLDEDGEPLARAMVTILRQQYVRGEKQLTPSGADQSDDRGQYRVFGLPPGEYFVSATAGGVEQIIRQFVSPLGPGIDQAPESSGYAATYYPGVISAGDAARVKLAASQELSGIDFQLQIVPLATVKGVVVGGSGIVMLVSEEGGPVGGGRGGAGGRGGGFGAQLGGAGLRATTKQDGTFSIPNVTPGKYTIIARTDGGQSAATRTAMQSIVVSGEEVNVSLTPSPGVELSGTMTLEASGATMPKGFTGFRVTPSPIGSAAAIPRMARPGAAVESGQFAVSDLMAGYYVIRAAAPSGWTMKAVYIDGRDVTDQPIEVRSENITGVNVIFTDKISGLTGTIRDQRGTVAAGVMVIAFPADDKLWLPQSRQIVTARTDPSGTYKLTAPPGDYLVIASDDVEQGEWFDPAFLDAARDRATRAKIGEGEQRTLDLKVPSS